MASHFIVGVKTNYPHKFEDGQPVNIYDKDGFIIGDVEYVEEDN